ncbi:hypothetical protein BSKO_11042 [Bryopsis sp. KO-2023]|nr:hypothetical protein BSKO_11042 [Bryopsis sp. KO-2023]
MGACFSLNTKPPRLQTRSSFRPVELLNGRYQVIEKLGMGSTATVYLAKDFKESGVVAIKKIERGRKVDLYIEREVLLHWSLSHPNVIGFREVFVSGEHLCIVLDYADGGDLVDFMNKHGNLSEQETRVIFRQLIEAVSYCHSKEVVNRDIKLENILVSYNNGKTTVKLADFGFSKFADDNVKTLLGTLGSCAPEILKYATKKSEYDGKKVDIWCTGVCLFRLLFGRTPFDQDTATCQKSDNNNPEVVKRKDQKDHVQRIIDCDLKIPTERQVQAGSSKETTVPVSEACQEILRGILSLEQERWSLDQIRQSEWFTGGEEQESPRPVRHAETPTPTPESQASTTGMQTEQEIRMVLQDARFSMRNKLSTMRVGTLGKISEVPSEFSNPQSPDRRTQSLTNQSVTRRVMLRARADIIEGSMTP